MTSACQPLEQRVLVTGAAGRIGRMLRPRLQSPHRRLWLLDTADQEPANPDENVELVTASVTDAVTMRAACRGMDAVLHLGGISGEDTWERIAEVNIDGTHTVLEAAREEGVSRVVLASSNHAVGFRTRAEADSGTGLAGDAAPRPDTYYGVSKAAMEALGSLYHSRFGMHVCCLRIGTCAPQPRAPRQLATWLSPDDARRLVEACLSATGFHVVWGVSANTRRWWSLAEGEAIGYRPLDDAEAFATQVLAESDGFDPRAPTNFRVGGEFCTRPLGEVYW